MESIFSEDFDFEELILKEFMSFIGNIMIVRRNI